MEQSRLAYSIDEFAAATGISRSMAYLEINRGRLNTAKVGKRRLVPAAEAQRWLDQRMQQKGGGDHAPTEK